MRACPIGRLLHQILRTDRLTDGDCHRGKTWQGTNKLNKFLLVHREKRRGRYLGRNLSVFGFTWMQIKHKLYCKVQFSTATTKSMLMDGYIIELDGITVNITFLRQDGRIWQRADVVWSHSATGFLSSMFLDMVPRHTGFEIWYPSRVLWDLEIAHDWAR